MNKLLEEQLRSELASVGQSLQVPAPPVAAIVDSGVALKRRSRGLIVGLTSAAVLVVIAGVLAAAYLPGMRPDGRRTTPVAMATPSPVDTSGMATPQEFYDSLPQGEPISVPYLQGRNVVTSTGHVLELPTEGQGVRAGQTLVAGYQSGWRPGRRDRGAGIAPVMTWQVVSGEQLVPLSSTKDKQVSAVYLSPSGGLVAVEVPTPEDVKEITIYSAARMTKLFDVSIAGFTAGIDNDGRVFSMHSSPDGALEYSVWDPNTRATSVITGLPALANEPTVTSAGIRFLLPDGAEQSWLLVSVADDGAATEVNRGKLEFSCAPSAPVCADVRAVDEGVLASESRASDQRLTILNTVTRDRAELTLPGFEGQYYRATWEDDEHLLLLLRPETMGPQDVVILRYTLGSGRLERVTQVYGTAGDLVIS